MGTTEISAPTGVPFIDISRVFSAPRELLFRAYFEPELLVQWLGPEKYEMLVDRWEPRDGGSWRYVHRGADGNDFGFHGVFHGPQTVEGMLHTFEFEGAPGHVSLDSLQFEEHAGGTRVRTHSTFQSVADRDAMVGAGMAGGVTEGFNRLEALMDRMTVSARR